jgi:CRP-like cAMP-binding protein
MKRPDHAFLRSIPFFQSATAEQLASLAELTGVETFQRGRVVVNQGSPGDAVYVVASGYLKVCMSGHDGGTTTLGIMERGDVLGELSLFDGGPRSATVVALTRATLVVLRRETFLSIVENNVHLALSVLALMGRRLRQLSERSDDVGSLCVGARLARRLVLLAERYGQQTGPRRLRIAVKLSQQELGDMIDATRESVNTHLKLWEREDLLVKEGLYFVIPDVDRLRAVSEHFDSGRFRPGRRRSRHDKKSGAQARKEL